MYVGVSVYCVARAACSTWPYGEKTLSSHKVRPLLGRSSVSKLRTHWHGFVVCMSGSMGFRTLKLIHHVRDGVASSLPWRDAIPTCAVHGRPSRRWCMSDRTSDRATSLRAGFASVGRSQLVPITIVGRPAHRMVAPYSRVSVTYSNWPARSTCNTTGSPRGMSRTLLKLSGSLVHDYATISDDSPSPNRASRARRAATSAGIS